MTTMANCLSTEFHIVSACSVEAQAIVPSTANVVLVFVSLAVVLPTAYGADVEKVIEGSIVTAGTKELFFLRHIRFIKVRVDSSGGAIPCNLWQSMCCIGQLCREWSRQVFRFYLRQIKTD